MSLLPAHIENCSRNFSLSVSLSPESLLN
jgi:hypothetical protein